MSTIIYVVTEGAYSDYHVEGIFSTEEKAQGYIDRNSRSTYDAGIEEWLLDEKQDWIDRTIWNCKMCRTSGDITNNWTYTESMSPQGRSTDATNSPVHIFASSSVSREHCHKLAAERRQCLLRTEAVAGSPPSDDRSSRG